MQRKKEIRKIIAILIIAFIIVPHVFNNINIPQVVKGSEKVEQTNSDFEIIRSGKPDYWSVNQNESYGTSTVNPVFEAVTDDWHSKQGSTDQGHSLHFKREDMIDNTYVENSQLFSIRDNGLALDSDCYTYTWGFWCKSKNSDSIMRLDMVIYDSNKNEIAVLRGNQRVLSKDRAYENEWKKVTTSQLLPDNAFYASYRLVFNAGKTDVLIDDLFECITENYNAVVVDSCDFHAETKYEGIAGWESHCDSFTIQDNVATVRNGTITRQIDTIVPTATYIISTIYTGIPSIGNIIFYDIENTIIQEESLLSGFEDGVFNAQFIVPEKTVYAKIVLGSNETITFSQYSILQTDSRRGENGWTANWVWYPSLVKQQTSCYYRTSFYVTDLSDVESAYFQFAWDDAVALYINGNGPFNQSTGVMREECRIEGKRSSYIYDWKKYLQEGKNLLAINVWNESQYGGVIFEGNIRYKDGTVIRIASGETETLTSTKDGQDWYKTDLDTTSWKPARKLGIPPYSEVGTASFWYGDSNVYTPQFDYTYLKNNIAQATAGQKMVWKIPSDKPKNADKKPDIVMAKFCEESKTLDDKSGNINYWYYGLDIYATVPMEISYSDGYTILTGIIPEYLPAGKYKVKFNQRNILIETWRGVVGTVNVKETKNDLKSSSVKKKNDGTVGLYVDNQEVAPVMYLRPQYATYYDYSKLYRMKESKTEIYCNYSGSLSGVDYQTDAKEIWTGNDSNGNPIINYELFDYEILRTLDLNSDGMIMAYINVDAPSWWKETHTSELIKNQNGDFVVDQYLAQSDTSNANQVSMTSTVYAKDAQKVLEALTKHMMEQGYASRMIGIRLSAGRTNEWMYYGVGDNIEDNKYAIVDYSNAALVGFREYLVEKYGTDANLQSAWADNNVTLSDVNIPTVDERMDETFSPLLNPANSKKTIDYNDFLSKAVSDRVIEYAQTMKNVMDEHNVKWIVGAYNGYLWNFGSSEAIGSTNTCINDILESDAIDFVASPANYGERVSGYSTGYMAMSDSIASHGKLYMIEQDNRTLYSQIQGEAGIDNSVGVCNTIRESVNQLTRDMSFDFVRNTGFWLYDMEGGWFNDSSFYARIAQIKNEYEKTATRDRGSNNEIAVFVGEKTYNYLVDDLVTGAAGSTHLMTYLYNEQRKALSSLGASYDTYTFEDLCRSAKDGTDILPAEKLEKYKLFIMLSPLEITGEQQDILTEKLKKDGKYVLWVYAPGISDGHSFAKENIEHTVDMSVNYSTVSMGMLRAKITDSMVLSDVNGALYGNTADAKGQKVVRVVINDSSTTQLAKYNDKTNVVDGLSVKVAAAYKHVIDGNKNYHSVYSAVPNISYDVLRAICDKAGVHRYSDNPSDIVETNNNYIALYSAEAGTKTIYLKNNSNVYNVFTGECVGKNITKFSYIQKSDETNLFRVASVNSDPDEVKIYIDGVLYNTMNPGDSFTLPGDAKYGYFSEECMYKPGSTIANIHHNLHFASVNEIKATMLAGASIRVQGESGIRFETVISTDNLEALDSEAITEGMLITANDLFESHHSEINLLSDYTFVNIKNSGWFKTDDSLKTRTYFGTIINIVKSNYIRSFIARSYVTIHYNDGDEMTIYADILPAEDGIRSIQQVAKEIIKLGYPGLSDEEKLVIDKYVN